MTEAEAMTLKPGDLVVQVAMGRVSPVFGVVTDVDVPAREIRVRAPKLTVPYVYTRSAFAHLRRPTPEELLTARLEDLP
jgi:hypothetical protein